MIRTALGSRVRKIDETAINVRGIPGIDLMEKAGEGLAEVIMKTLGEINGKRVVIVCGAGNNGGDGYVAARILAEAGMTVQVFSLIPPEKLKGDAKTNYDVYVSQRGRVRLLDDDESFEEFTNSCREADVITDSIFGTGISRSIEGKSRKAIELINASGKYIISVDIPSGVGADDGKIYGISVKADKTVTFEMSKVGMYAQPGRSMAGDIEVIDIGLPKDLCEEETGIIYAIEKDDAKKLLPKRNVLMNKGDAGKLLIVAGSKGMAGAAVLAAMAAYRSGAGLVKVAAVWEVVQVIQNTVPEATCLILNDDVNNNIKLISKEAENYDAVAVGPGLGKSDNAKKLAEHIIKNIEKPVLADADAINLVSENTDILKQRKKGALVMTPHPGEMGRLIKMTPKEVNEDRLRIAQFFASEYNVTLVLKGAGSIIACPDGAAFINITGNAGMATAGSGDVLSGIVGAFLSAGLSAKDSAVLGAYVHGLSGDLCSCEFGEYGTTASDIAEFSAMALKKLTASK